VHEHAHGHTHGSGDDARRLAVVFALIVAFMAGEVTAGILAHSLALLSDAAHMLTDAGALAMSLVVLRLAAQPAGGNRTFGLRRSEILSAQANGATLLVLAGLIVYGAVRRLVSPPQASGTCHPRRRPRRDRRQSPRRPGSSPARTGARSTSKGASSTC